MVRWSLTEGDDFCQGCKYCLPLWVFNRIYIHTRASQPAPTEPPRPLKQLMRPIPSARARGADCLVRDEYGGVPPDPMHVNRVHLPHSALAQPTWPPPDSERLPLPCFTPTKPPAFFPIYPWVCMLLPHAFFYFSYPPPTTIGVLCACS